MFKVGFAGTAKNTGKTTAVMYFLRQAASRKERVGLTGIGYDGEDFDRAPDGIQKCRCPPHEILPFSNGYHTLDIDPIMQQFILVIEQNCGY